MPGDTLPPTEQQMPPPNVEANLAEATAFLDDVAPHLGRLFGMDLTIKVGDGWATNLETGEVTADPRFFLEKGYTPDMSSYAILHETTAHLREVVTEPTLTNQVIKFASQGEPQHLFHNILADVAGNNLIHAVLPRMADTAKDLYQQKLFIDNPVDEKTGKAMPYDQIPRHFQFLYKIIRDEMIPDSETVVKPEVQAALDGLRDYQGQGDLIKYSTSVAKSARELMPATERFAIWKNIIYPVYEDLLEQDRQDPAFQGDGSGDADGQPSDQPAEGEPSGKSKPGDGDAKQFGKYYEDYDKNKHPEPISDEDHQKIHDHAKSTEQATKQSKKDNHEKILDQKIKEETGHSLQEQRLYDAEVIKFQEVITEMREAYQQIINERVTMKRGLSRRTMPEGAILDPDRLSQTVIDIRAGVTDPEVFRDYETKRGEAESVGKTDYVFVLDVSGSMANSGKAQAAASSIVIGLEGLAALQRDVKEAEAQHKVELDLDIRTAIYTFGDRSKCLKPLSTTLSPKERLDTYQAVRRPTGNSTQDFLALEDVKNLPKEADRRQIMIVVSDGQSDDPPRARRAIDTLRGNGWFVYGIGIGSDDATNLYKPTSRRVDDPADLPATISSFIEATIT